MADLPPRQYLDPSGLDWTALRSATLEVCYGLRYEYPGPIEQVRQMLMLVPADRLGTQTLIEFSVESQPHGRPRFSFDRFGNRVCHIALERVESSLEFLVTLQVRQEDGQGTPVVDGEEPSAFL